MEIDPTIRYLLTHHTTFLFHYGFDGFRKRKIDVVKIISKVNELYGPNFNGEQFIEFGEKHLDGYLAEKHGITFAEILLEGFGPVLPRFNHLV